MYEGGGHDRLGTSLLVLSLSNQSSLVALHHGHILVELDIQSKLDVVTGVQLESVCGFETEVVVERAHP